MILINMNFKKMPLVYEMIWKVTLLGEGNKVFFWQILLLHCDLFNIL